MRIERQIRPYVIHSESSIQEALQKINRNARRTIYCVSESGLLEGIVTDGDFRRWVVNQEYVDLQKPVSEIANKDFVSASLDDSSQAIAALFSPKIQAVPIVDGSGRLNALAWSDADALRILDRTISDEKPTFIIAEIGNNHNGSIELAKHLVGLAADAGADCIKFQMRDLESLYLSGAETSEDLGTEYTLDLLKKVELSPSKLFEVMDYVQQKGLVPLCTPWDQRSLERLNEYGVPAFKFASADLTNHELLGRAAEFRLPLLVSTGMSRESEIIGANNLLKAKGASFAFLHCNSTYPTPMKDVNLAYLARLREITQAVVGYSGHERGFEVVVAAVALGARIVEKHFTIDKSMEGNDHRVSLLPDEFRQMVAAIRNVEEALGRAEEREVSQGERLNREVLAKSLVAKRAIRCGEILSRSMIDVKSPGRGLQPHRIGELVGKVAVRDYSLGAVFYESDLKGKIVKPRRYSFNRPYGVPVRYHDISELLSLAPVDFVEIHFSYRDLDLEPTDFLKYSQDCGLVVHAPELFANDHVMDLSSDDRDYRERSLSELQRVVDCTRTLKPLFSGPERPVVIINAGGFSEDSFISIKERKQRYDRVARALKSLSAEDVEIVVQTMPPFPWHFGGQRYHNLFLDADEIVGFCNTNGCRICLDVSHSMLACNFFDWSFTDFIRKVGPYVAHLHIVDARGTHDEGLQIGEGSIDFAGLWRVLDEVAPGVPFIPEIWQGHKNSGEGFWIALAELEARSNSNVKVKVELT